MHLVVIAWLYIVGVMALAASSVGAGVLLFVLGGLLPVLGLLGWLARQRKARANRTSAFQPKVHRRDDRDP